MSITITKWKKTPFGGAAWKAKLTHIHYKNGNKISSRREHYDNDTATAVFRAELADAKIIQQSAYSIKLSPIRWKSVADNLFVHQFAIAMSKDGHLLTFEKIPTCIPMQSCNIAETPLNVFIQLKDG